MNIVLNNKYFCLNIAILEEFRYSCFIPKFFCCLFDRRAFYRRSILNDKYRKIFTDIHWNIYTSKTPIQIHFTKRTKNIKAQPTI